MVWISVIAYLSILLLYIVLFIVFHRRILRRFSRIREIVKNFNLLLNLIFLYIIYRVSAYLLNLRPFIEKLSTIYIVRTELVSISILSVISGIYVLLLVYYTIEFFKHLVYHYYLNQGNEVTAGFMKSLIANIGILIVTFAFMSGLGISWKVLIPVLSALGVGVGFGLQTIFNNYASGFILLLSRKVKVGDVVELEGNAGYSIGNTSNSIYGRVVSVDFLSTIIRTMDGIEISVPNSEFISGKIINYTLSDPYVRVRVPVPVSYDADPKKVEEILLQVVSDVEGTVRMPGREPEVWFFELSDSALVFYVVFWVDLRKLVRVRYVRSQVYYSAWKRLKEAGIRVPYPQRDLWFKNTLKVEIERDV